MKDPKKAIIHYLVNRKRKLVEKKYYKKFDTFRFRDTALIDKSIVNQHRDLWQPLSKSKIDDRWLKLYSGANQVISHQYVPEYLYYSTIEQILNNPVHDASYSDKNFYNLIYDQNIFPDTILRNLDGSFYDRDYTPVADIELFIKQFVEDRIVVKPSIDSGGGANVELFERKSGTYNNRNGSALDREFLESEYGSNYLIQKVIEQHEFYAHFNSSSLNTVRVFTYRSVKDNSVHVLQTVLRVGAAGNFVDNMRAGGYAIGVGGNGILNKFGIDKYGEKKEVSFSDKVRGRHVYKFDEICKTAIDIAKKNLYHRVLGLDMAVDSSGVVRCIEVNNRGNEINFFQLNNGPLFREFTDEVAEYCRENMSNLYNYYIMR